MIEIIEVGTDVIELIDVGVLNGPPGPAGPTGPAGPAGQGVPIGGTTNQVLAKNSNTNFDTKWADPTGGGGGNVSTDTIWDAKGDIAVATGSDTASKLGVGPDGQVLTADATQPTGLKWATPAAGGGSGVIPYIFTSTKTANYSASINEYIPVDATSGAVTITLPSAPLNGTRVAVDVIANPSSNTVSVTRGGTDVIGNPAGSTQFRTLTIVAQKWRGTYNNGCWFEDVRNGSTSAANTPITPTATLTSTNVQNALQEIDGDIQALPTLTTSNTSKVPIATTLGVTKIDVDGLQASTALTTKGDLYVATANNVVTRLGVGADGQVLTADAAQTPGLKWATPTGGGGGSVATDTIWNAKGDIAAATGADAAAIVSLGTNGQVLTADNTQTAGVKWATPTSGDVYVHMTADGYSAVNITQQADTGFSVTLAASSKYIVDIVVFFTADTGADIKASFHYPTGATALFSLSGWHTSTAGGYSQFSYDHTNFTWNFGSAVNPPSVNNFFGHGVVTTTNSGLLEFWYAQLATLASPATIRKAGSYIYAKKIA